MTKRPTHTDLFLSTRKSQRPRTPVGGPLLLGLLEYSARLMELTANGICSQGFELGI